jgi:adhesin HecA-like repeat protein
MAAVVLLAAASPAAADISTGTITNPGSGVLSIPVTATVASGCTVITGGSGTSFSDTITFSPLDASDGTLRSDLAASSAVSGAIKTFQINCSGANATVDLKAGRLINAGGTTEAGYSAKIDFSTDLVITRADATTKTFTYTTQAVLPADTTGSVGQALSNAPGDVVIKVYSLTSENGPTSLLEDGTYNSTITVSITPST